MSAEYLFAAAFMIAGIGVFTGVTCWGISELVWAIRGTAEDKDE